MEEGLAHATTKTILSKHELQLLELIAANDNLIAGNDAARRLFFPELAG